MRVDSSAYHDNDQIEKSFSIPMMEKSYNDVSEIEQFDGNAQWHVEEYATFT